MGSFFRQLIFGMFFIAWGFTAACKRGETSRELGLKSEPFEIAKLIVLRDDVRAWALRCGVSASKDNCDVGDATLFNGLLCLSGDELSCEAVRRSQGSDGRIWRAEFRVAADAVNSFSRDMAMGVLAYLVATKDVELARRWMIWIENNNWRLCRESSDNRCDFTPGFWSLFRDVWKYLGLPLNQNMSSAFLDDSVLALLQSQFAPAGFELHLSSVNLLVRRSMGQQSATLNSLSQALAMRQGQNPFFAYLAEGASSNVLRRATEWCPRAAPSFRTEWSFERNEQDKPWERSMGWECVMLINFLLRDLNEGSVTPPSASAENH